MWRKTLFIRHNCGEHKNYVGHRWSKRLGFFIQKYLAFFILAGILRECVFYEIST